MRRTDLTSTLIIGISLFHGIKVEKFKAVCLELSIMQTNSVYIKCLIVNNNFVNIFKNLLQFKRCNTLL